MNITMSRRWVEVLFITSRLFVWNVTVFVDSHGPSTDLDIEEVVREQLNALRFRHFPLPHDLFFPYRPPIPGIISNL